MADTQGNIEQQVENIILANFAEQQETQSQDNTGERKVIDVDLYRLEGGALLLVPNNGENPLERDAVGSDPPTDTEARPPITDPPIEQPSPTAGESQQEALPLEQERVPAPTETQRPVKRSFGLVPLVLLCVLAAGAASYWYLLPLAATATIIITAKARSFHTDATFIVAANPKAGQVQGRPLERISFTRSMTVPATGHAHDEATRATGVITFYNADIQAYTVPAGTSFTVGNVTVVTDTTVTVQAVVPPMLGTAYAPAHVIQTGSRGNIAAGTIGTRCCGSQFLTATNASAFTGGQDAKDYSFIQTSDIQNAVTDLLGSLTPRTTAAFQQQAHAGEQLVTPLCTPRTTSSQNAGTEGASVTVFVTQTCTSVAYLTDSLNQVATSVLSHRANVATYEQRGTTQVTINGSTYAHHTAFLKVSLSGIWVYHFPQAQVTQLVHKIVGESQEKAKATLERVEGVAQVSIHLQRFDFKDVLPTNPQRISIQFFDIVS